jgi:hypothetical protein
LKIQIMNKLLPITLTLLIFLASVVAPSSAAPARPKCNSTLKAVRNSLTGVLSFELRNIGNQGQPRGRSQTLDIIFKDVQGQRFPTDASQKAIATRVIRSCAKIASVVFALEQSDGGNIYGIKNNQIIEFTCVDAGGEKKLPWGETYCP